MARMVLNKDQLREHLQREFIQHQHAGVHYRADEQKAIVFTGFAHLGTMIVTKTMVNFDHEPVFTFKWVDAEVVDVTSR